jgi:hypothetical protein
VATRASLIPYFLRDKFGLEQEGHVKKPIIGRLIVCSLAIFAVDAFAAQHVACNVQGVQIVSGNHARVAIRCASETPIVWFAYRQSNNPTTAQMILHVATAAAVHNKTIDIYYDKDESGYAWGCLHSDCRVITWLEMRD